MLLIFRYSKPEPKTAAKYFLFVILTVIFKKWKIFLIDKVTVSGIVPNILLKKVSRKSK